MLHGWGVLPGRMRRPTAKRYPTNAKEIAGEYSPADMMYKHQVAGEYSSAYSFVPMTYCLPTLSIMYGGICMAGEYSPGRIAGTAVIDSR